MGIGKFFASWARGWAMGLGERDKPIWGATIACAAFAGLIGVQAGTQGSWLRGPSLLATRPACANRIGAMLAGIHGRHGWITTGAGTPMTAQPGYNPRNRMVFPYTPLVVLGAAGGYYEVAADVGQGHPVRGFVRADRVQFENPAADAEAEDGWLKVTAKDGAQLRIGPDLNTFGYRPPAAAGAVLREVGVVREMLFFKTNTRDFYLVDRPGTKDCAATAWVARWQVERVAKP